MGRIIVCVLTATQATTNISHFRRIRVKIESTISSMRKTKQSSPYNPRLIIGDVHSHVAKYAQIVERAKVDTLQVGDFGLKESHEWHAKNIDSAHHKILFGNHDDTTYLGAPHSLGDWCFLEESNIFCVRGAASIDRNSRTVGIDWWDDEEINNKTARELLEVYKEVKPRIVISHDAPVFVRRELFRYRDVTRTASYLEGIFVEHQPSLWIFGHHHERKDKIIKGTRFVCLEALGTFHL